MTVLEDVYTERVLELAAKISNTGRLARAQATASAHSKLCGSKITVDLAMEDGIVTGFAQDVRACLLGQCSASVVGANLVGTHEDEFRIVARAMRKMLKEGAAPPHGRWSDLAILEPVRDLPARHASTLLVFDAVEQAMDEASAKTSALRE